MNTVSKIVRIVIFILLYNSYFVACTSSNPTTNTTNKYKLRQQEKQMIDYVLDPIRYDKRIRPPFNVTEDGPVTIFVNIFIRSILKIDDINMDYTVQITFRQQWNDDRLQYKQLDGGNNIKYLTLIDSSKIWMPDLFFSNEKEGHLHKILLANEYLRIFPDGSILFSTRITLKLSCPMNFKYLPFDRQVCSIRMASYGYTTEDIVFLWKPNDPVSINKNLHLPRFTLERFLTNYCNSRTATGEYSCLKFDIMFKRELSFYLIQIYIPCCMLIILSWVSFWVDENAIAARLLLGVSTLLTMSFHVIRINAFLPQISYTTAIDVWTGVSLTFVFATILEFVTVHYLSCEEQKRKSKSIGKSAKNDIEDVEHTGSTLTTKATESPSSEADILTIEKAPKSESETQSQSESRIRMIYKNFMSRVPEANSKKIDVFARIVFPLVFLLFIIIYWLSYKVIVSNQLE